MARSKNKSGDKENSDNNEWLGWMQELKDFQESSLDQYTQGREADRFILDREGQWEDDVAERIDSQHRPRYTFDQVTPVIEFIMADIEAMEFGSNVKPASGEASEDVADILEGMIRGIEADSDAVDTYRSACRRIIRRGFDAWVVRSKFRDEMSFDQDLTVEPIPNAINRVWTSNTSTKEDSSDSPSSYILTSASPEAYKNMWPEGSGISIDDSDLDEHYDDYHPEVIVFGERYYQKETTREIAQMSNGDVLEVDEKYEMVRDELQVNGITEKRRKKVKDFKFYHRFFDGGGFLDEEKETVFNMNPVVTVYGNYELLGESSKVTFHGMVLKEMDYQRVLNYAKSREVEEGALAPREKTWMTTKQAAGHKKQLSAMNVSADPVQFYNPDPEAPQPYKTPPSQINPHLAKLSQDMSEGIRITAGVNNAMNGEYAGRMSEDALKLQIERGTGATRKWVNALAKGIRRTCEILVDTIPRVYDTKRQFMLVGEDGKEEVVTLNDEIYDRQSQQMVQLNTLSKGKYKVVCDAGPAFANRQEAGLHAMLKYAEIDPGIIQTGGDLMLKSIDAPLVDKMAERKRRQLIQAGVIPEDQLTDEEKEQLMAMAQQPKEPDAMTIAAMAEDKKATADLADAETKRMSAQTDQFNAETNRINALIKAKESGVKIENTQMDTVGKALDNQGKQIDNVQKIVRPN